MQKHDGMSLREYIRSLVKDGKNSQHEDFQRLFKVYTALWGKAGRDKIIKIAKEEIAKDKIESKDEDQLL